MRRWAILIILAIFWTVFIPRICQANEAGDLEKVLSVLKPGQKFSRPSFLTAAKVINTDVMYEGRLGDITILAWVESDIVDSVFLTVNGKLCNTWTPIIAKYLDEPAITKTNRKGQFLRYYNNDYEYYLVLLNKQSSRDPLTDLSLFRRGPEHQYNERYHESGDIWLSIFSTE